MKFFLSIVLLCFSITANASLKLTSQVNAYDQGKNTRPSAGLSWYQPLMKGVAFNSYAGVGDEPFEVKDDALWFVGKAQVDVYMGRWTIAPGILYKHIEPYDQSRTYGYLRVDYKLLD